MCFADSGGGFCHEHVPYSTPSTLYGTHSNEMEDLMLFAGDSYVHPFPMGYLGSVPDPGRPARLPRLV